MLYILFYSLFFTICIYVCVQLFFHVIKYFWKKVFNDCTVGCLRDIFEQLPVECLYSVFHITNMVYNSLKKTDLLRCNSDTIKYNLLKYI